LSFVKKYYFTDKILLENIILLPKIVNKSESGTSYQERRRDWPCDARQPPETGRCQILRNREVPGDRKGVRKSPSTYPRKGIFLSGGYS
jgi:hypothetical protein